MNWLKFTVLFAILAMPSIGSSQERLSEVLPGSKAATLESCVRETPDMRRNHMKYLFHKRDKTMREGVRTEDLSLNACVSCHAVKSESGHYLPVNEEGQFCQSCHERVSQKLDCFSCHRTTPES